MLDHQRGHFRLVHANTQPVTGNARLRHLEQGTTDPVAVSDTHFCIRQTIDGKVLSELSVNEVISSKVVLPVPIGIHLIDEHSPTFAAVTGQVTLSVAVYVEPAHHARPSTGVFQMPVWTVLPCQVMSRGRPTLTESRRPITFPDPVQCSRRRSPLSVFVLVQALEKVTNQGCDLVSRFI